LKEKGTLAAFFSCKIGVALVAFALIGMAFAAHSNSRLFAERQEIEDVAAQIADAIETLDGISGEAELRRELRSSAGQLEVHLKGEQRGEIQLVRIRVVSKFQAERLLVLRTPVNGGNFDLSVSSPSEVAARKCGEIWVELF
jgi:hypothetical protein